MGLQQKPGWAARSWQQCTPAAVAHLGGREVFAGEPLVMMSAGLSHTAGVTKDGALWSWGDGGSEQLVHGNREPRQRPQRLGREMFGELPAVMVACWSLHMLVLTSVGFEWIRCYGDFGKLGHGDQLK